MPRRYPIEFRRRVLDLLKAGRSVAELVRDLEISDQTIYNWRRQDLIDTGQLPGVTSTDQAELVAARRRITEPGGMWPFTTGGRFPFPSVPSYTDRYARRHSVLHRAP
ncbi:transposase [Micromonospora sp. CPCC 205554]|uniref:transposase n=1 Tax=Micromonospora sp. CPCC 205554 TaxID=3122401 RepID=UPI002FF0846A